MDASCIEVPYGERIDVAVLMERGFIGLERGLRTGRPRFPYCSRPWCPGNRAYLCDRGYYIDASSTGPGKIRVYASTIRSVITSRFYDVVSAGFQHSLFMRRFWPVLWRAVARLSSYEDLSAQDSSKTVKLDVVDVDVLVVGGGLAGIEASLSASKAGARVLLVEYRRLGGFISILDYNLVGDRIKLVTNTAGIKVLVGYKYVGLFSEGHVVIGDGRVVVVRPKSVVYATGSVSPPPLIRNNDLPGLVSLDYGLELVREGYRPRRVVVIGGSYWSVAVAKALADAGSLVVFIPVESLSREAEEALSKAEIDIEDGRVEGLKGVDRVEGVVLSDGRIIKGEMVLSGVEEYPDANPAYAAGAVSSYCSGRKVITPKVNSNLEAAPSIYVAGSIVGDQGLEEVIAGARLAGIAAAVTSGYGDHSDIESAAGEYWKARSYYCSYEEIASNVRIWISDSIDGLQFVDTEAEVTVSDLMRAWESGYRSMEKIKRVTGLGTGLEQGRISAHTAALLLSKYYRVPVSSIGLFKSRPPHMLPSFGDLAIGDLA